MLDPNPGGLDPAAVLQDLLETAHWVTRVKLAPEAADDIAVAERLNTMNWTPSSWTIAPYGRWCRNFKEGGRSNMGKELETHTSILA